MKSSNVYTVMGATGKVGYELARTFINKGYSVRAVGRDSKKLTELQKMGAKTYSVAFDNYEELTKIFTGSTAVFTMLPSAYSEKDYYAYSDKVSQAYYYAIEKSGVKYVVNLSSVGAQYSEGTGIIKAHYYNEQRLNSLKGVNVMHIRAPYFMENFYWSSQEIESKGTLSLPFRKDLSVYFVSTSDVAKKAYEYMEKLSYTGYSYVELYGPENVTYEQAASYFSKAYNRPVHYYQSSYNDAEKMLATYYNTNSAKYFVEYYKAMNEGRISYTQKQNPQNTCTYTFNSFATQYYNKKKVAA